MKIHQQGAWLAVDFEQPQRTLSWALVGGGVQRAHRVAWRRVNDADVAGDVVAWAQAEAAAHGVDGPLMLTAAKLERFVERQVEVAGVVATAVVTVGLSNRLRIGDPPVSGALGTINLLVHLDRPLSLEAQLEAVSLAVQARTVAVQDSGLASVVSGAPATGTGTDCVVLACPEGAPELRFAGMHTAVGAALGQAALQACDAAVRSWVRTHGP